MLELLGTIGANVLSLPGILGLGFGMMTRNYAVAAAIGAAVGLAETLVFARLSFANLEMLELSVSVGVGILAGLVGCAVRRKGAVV